MARRWSKKRRSTPVKRTKTYKDGTRQAWITGGLLGVLTLAVFHQTRLGQMIVANTPTFNGNGA